MRPKPSETNQPKMIDPFGGIFGQPAPAAVACGAQLIPYTIIALNCFLFAMLRKLIANILSRLQQPTSNKAASGENSKRKSDTNSDHIGLLRRHAPSASSFVNELVSTLELCADCAELNVVYEKHGQLAYGAALALLTYWWLGTFGEALASPGYLAEDLWLYGGKQLFRDSSFWAKLSGQLLAMPLAWRLHMSLYWRHQLLREHAQLLVHENCHSALTTSLLSGFLVEFTCSLLCRLIELITNEVLLKRRLISQQSSSLICSISSTVLVLLALELSGGYFNPVLAASLEFGCKGIETYQHAIVFWLAPLTGHVLARLAYLRLTGSSGGNVMTEQPIKRPQQNQRKAKQAATLASQSNNNNNNNRRRSVNTRSSKGSL